MPARFRLVPTRLLLIAGLLAPGALLRADDKPVAPPGYHLVPVRSGHGTGYLLAPNPAKPGAASQGTPDSNHPDEFNYSAASSYAGKSYDFGGNAAGHDGSSQKDVERTFATKSYFTGPADDADKTVPGLDRKVPLQSFDGFDRTADGAEKKFAASDTDSDQNKTSDFASKTDDDQGRSAILGGQTVKTYANAMASKTYEGPEAMAVKRDLNRMNQGLESIKDLPDRPLTVDEVRALIDHGIKPDLDAKPAAPSKALNDPDYTPDAAPAPLRDDSSSAIPDQDSVPAPGTMAHPENAEPLPR